MKVEKRSVKEAGSCNYCQRSVVRNGLLSFPYEHVYVIEGNSCVVSRMCEDCMKEFAQKVICQYWLADYPKEGYRFISSDSLFDE